MAGALKAGGVYVAVSAAIGEFTKTMGQVVKSIEDTAKKVKEAAKSIADVGAIFAGAMGAAVLAASSSNRAIQADLEKLKAYLYTLAADFGDAFGPALRQLTELVGSVVGAFQRLSPEVKEAVAHFTVLMASVGGGALALSKAAGLVEGVAKGVGIVLVPALNAASTAAKALGAAGGAAFPKLGKAVAGMEAGVLQSVAKMAAGFGAVLIPVAAVAAAVAGVALLAGSLYEAWNDSSTGLKASVLSIWESIKGLGQQLMEMLSGWWQALQEVFTRAVREALELVAHQVRSVANIFAPLARGLRMDALAGTLEDLRKLTGDQILADLRSGASFLAEKVKEGATVLKDGALAVGKEVAEGVSYGLNYSTKGLKRLAKDTGLEALPDKLKAALSGVLGGAGPNVREQFEPVEVGTVGKAEMSDAFRQEFLSGMSSAMRARLDYLKEQARKLAEETAAAIHQARESLIGRAFSALGSVGSMIQNAMQAAAAGPWAVVASIAMDLLSRSEGFKRAMEVIEGIIGMVADALGQLFEALMPLLGALGALVASVLPALTPIFESLRAVLEPLAPPLMVVAELLNGLMPVLQLLIQALNPVLLLLQLVAGPVMKGLVEVLRFVSTIILKVVKGLGDAWNGIVGAIQKVFRSLADISIFGAKPLGFLDGWADGLERAKVDTEAMARALQALTGMTYEAALERARETAEVVRNRKELERTTESLSNVPSAWKAALARFEVQDPQEGPTAPDSGGSVPVPTTPPPGASGPWGPAQPGGSTTPGQPPPGAGGGMSPGSFGGMAAPFIDTINIATTNVADSVERLGELMDRFRFLRTGTRGVPGRFAVSGS
jgi:phage-related protein